MAVAAFQHQDQSKASRQNDGVISPAGVGATPGSAARVTKDRLFTSPESRLLYL